MKTKSEKWSIQISGDLTEGLKKYCKDNGYTMNGFIEKLIKEKIMSRFITKLEANELKYQRRKNYWEHKIEQQAEDKDGIDSFLKVFKESVNDIGAADKCHFENKGFSKMKDSKLILTILKDMGFEKVVYSGIEDKLTVEW